MTQSTHDVELYATDYQGNESYDRTLKMYPGADTTQDPEKQNNNIRWVVEDGNGTKRFETKEQVKKHYNRHGYTVKIK